MSLHLLRPLAIGLVMLAPFCGLDTAAAMWAPAPIEVLIDQADLVIAGKVTGVAPAGFALHNRPQSIATIDVLRVLKSLPGHGQPKLVKLAQPAVGGLALSTDLAYRVGQEGIWLLRRDDANGVYVVNHPSQYQPADQWKTLSALVVARQKLAGSKPVAGLVARSEVFTTTQPKGPTSFEVRLSLQNITDKPITICMYNGNKPLQAEWITPDGEQAESVHYKWLERVRLAGVQASNFETIPAGGVRYIGASSPETGIFFQSALGRPSAAINTVGPGEHQVTVSYVNAEDGKPLGLENVWTGTIVAPALTFTAP